MIQDQTTKVIYVGNGQTTHFPFKFKYNDKAHIHVAIYDIDTQVQTELTKDFFVDSEKNEVIYPGYQSGQEPPEAQIPPVLQANQKLVIYRQTPLTQEIDFGSKYPLPFVENGTDKNTMISQEMKEALERSVKVDMGSEVKPDELLTDIKQNVADANQSAQNAQQSADEAQEYAQNANANAQSINIRTFQNVESMKQANNLKAGGLIKTQGFYQPNDSGGADYVITNDIGEDEADETNIITLQKGLYAKLLIRDCVNVKWFGAYGDNKHDDTQALQKALYFSVKNGYTINFTKDTYLITDTLVINSGGGYFKGIEGKGATLRYPNIENKPAISIRYGSGDIKEQDIYNLMFVGSETSTGIEIKGAGGIYPINCYFAKNKYGVVFSNDVSAGTFTEGNIVIRCRFTSDCETAIYYYKGNGDSSFHGSGLRDCWIDTKADVPTIKIDEGAMPYNAPLSFRLLKPEGSKAVIENLSTERSINFFGNITVEGEIITLAEGNTVYFTGAINTLGKCNRGTFTVVEEIQVKGSKGANVTAFKRKREVRKYTFNKNEKISFYFPAGTIEIRQGDYYHILTIANFETGFSPRIQSPIQTLNPTEFEKLNITFSDNSVNFTPDYDGAIYLVLNYGITPATNGEVFDYEN